MERKPLSKPQMWKSISEDIPGWLVANEGKLTVALEVTITEELRREGIARELGESYSKYT